MVDSAKNCPSCGTRSASVVRCTFSEPARTCDAPGGGHLHLFCTKCGAERVAVPEARELAWLASRN